MADQVKQVAIRGDAVAAYTKERKTRKRRVQDGGYDVPSPAGAIPLTSANMSRVTNFVRKMSGGANATTTAMLGGSVPAPASPASPASPTLALPKLAAPAVPAAPAPPQAGGAKPKLILEPKKKSMKKLHLAPASVSGKRSVSKTRKIRVNLHGMKRRLTRAKEIHKESRHKDIAHIKKTLIDAKLIKPREQGKPESTEYDMMLRKTYENYMLLRNRAL